MYRKIRPDCGSSSFSPDENLEWDCLFCAICASELARYRDDLLVCKA